MEDCKSIGIYLKVNLKIKKLINKEHDEVENQIQGILYKVVVDLHLYPMVGIRMDLAYDVSVVN